MSTREQEAAPKTYLNPTGKKWSHGLEIAEMENEISALRAELAAAREALAKETKRLDKLIDSQLVVVSAFDEAYCLADRDGNEVGDWHNTPREAIDAGRDET